LISIREDPAFSLTSTPLEWYLTGPHSVAVTEAWDKGVKGDSNKIIAVIDSGLQASAIGEPFVPNVVPGYDFCSDPDTCEDGDGRDEDTEDVLYDIGSLKIRHGTWAARTAATVAPATTIMPIRVIGNRYSGTMSDVVDAITWASGGTINGVASNPHKIFAISMSLGGLWDCEDYLQNAVNMALQKGILLFSAAGNDYGMPAKEYWPGNCDGVITIGIWLPRPPPFICCN